ncbi:MAG: ADP-ribosylglycohydrolase family protein [Candidatus Eremiobacteraeota bacterium]|nr:ADP-ribosylglycohydrolase family protein [Candidatus Eremiobacteraeota bacterium]
MSNLERAYASLRGLALGDAFGERFFGDRGHAWNCIRLRYLPVAPWEWTDDTAMALSVYRVLRDHGQIHQEELALSFAAEHRLEPGRGYGRGAHDVLSAISACRGWRQAAADLFGGEGSCGNGAAMRVAPVGAFFYQDLEKVVQQARLSAEITHAHPDGIAGAIAVALAAALVLRGLSGRELLDEVRKRTPAGATRHGLEKALNLPAETPLSEVVKTLGNGSEVLSSDTVPYSLWCAGHYGGDFQEALWKTVEGLGDRDTTCAIVGGILGAARPLPEDWWACCEPIPFNADSAVGHP